MSIADNIFHTLVSVLATSERNTNKPIAVSYDGECIPKELSVVKCCSHVHKASIVLVRLDVSV